MIEKVNIWATSVVAILSVIVSSTVSVWVTKSQLDKDFQKFSRGNYQADFQVVKDKAEDYINLTIEATSLISNENLNSREQSLLFVDLDQAAMSLMIHSGPTLGLASFKLNMAIKKSDGRLTSEASNAWLEIYFAEMNAYTDTATPIKTNAEYEDWLNRYLLTLEGYAE